MTLREILSIGGEASFAAAFGWALYRRLRLRGSKGTLEARAATLMSSVTPNVRSSFRVAVIDDEISKKLPEPSRAILRDRGFIIDYFADIKTVDELKWHQIVLCDVYGVGEHLSLDSTGHGGLIVSELRKRRPLIYIIIYSGAANYDPEFNRYFAVADDVANWTSLIGERLVEILDKSIRALRSPHEQWKRFGRYVVDNTANDVPAKDIERLHSYFLKMTPEESAALETRVSGLTSSAAGDASQDMELIVSASELVNRLLDLTK